MSWQAWVLLVYGVIMVIAATGSKQGKTVTYTTASLVTSAISL
ncbi:hypothetical protein OZX67_03990 [Bifidobacterium sp. ESL0728]|nr:hypothetical protein [Bifidobacterium sp. ESL0728]WEV59708.1 hypothetical protein OZX67_03990 [Bifidobacterium sp. ESL0728]